MDFSAVRRKIREGEVLGQTLQDAAGTDAVQTLGCAFLLVLITLASYALGCVALLSVFPRR
jgi:hypothetical protein